MQSHDVIEEKLFGRYENFLRYCKEAGKKFVDELDSEDFIAYRSEYSVSREQIDMLKNQLGFREHKFEEKSLSQDVSEPTLKFLREHFQLNSVTPYETVSIAEIDFDNRIQNCLRRHHYKTLAELLNTSTQDLLTLDGFDTGYFENLLATLKKFFDSDSRKDTANSLQAYFKVTKLAPYENILVSDLDFNARVQHVLKREGYMTLAELLRVSQQDFLCWRDFGQGSLDNLLKTLKNFFTAQRKSIPRKAILLANEELGEFLRDAAFTLDPQIDLIIAAFEKFNATVAMKKLFRDLPEEIKSKRVNPFLGVCSLKLVLPEDWTFADLSEYLSHNPSAFDIKEIENFVAELRFDVRACAKKILTTLFKNKRELEIVRRRAEGATLEDIGKNFELTRERVRQIEFKLIGKFKVYKNDAKKIFCFIHALTDGKLFLTFDDVKNFLGIFEAQILWFFVVKTNLSSNIFHFDEEINTLVFSESVQLDENYLIKNLPDVMEEKFFEDAVINLAREKNCPVELVKIKLSKIYRRRGKIVHRGRLTLTFECGYVLKERFPNGYKVGDEIFYSRFIRHLQEIFDEKTPLTQHNVDAKIGNIGVLCDRGKYIHSDFFRVSPEIIERVKDFIDASDRTAFLYKEIFESLKEIFIGTQITNHYFLQGAIKFYNLPYTLRKDYLTKASEIDISKEFDNFIAERGEVSTQEIKENFISFKDFNIGFLVRRCPEVISIGGGILIHASHLNLPDEDFKPIKKFLIQNCSNPVNSRVLFDLFFERFADFMTRNDIQSHNKLFSVLQYMFGDDFYFSRPYISTADIKDISNKKILLSLLESVEEIEIEDLLGICEENGIHYGARTYLIETLRPDFVRVDEFVLMRPESIGVTDEIISAVVESIQSAIERNGGWQAAQTFEDYEWLPQLETSWNSFLLESVVFLSDNAPCKLKIPSTSWNFSTAIFLSEEFAQDDFQSFLTKILIIEHDKEPFRSEKEIFNWLQEQGLCNKKLPKFLEGGRAFKFLSE